MRNGVELRKRVSRFLNHMKQVFPHNTGAKQDLVDGYYVVRLYACPKSYEDFMTQDCAILEAWYQVGLLYLSPYEPTCQRVFPVDDALEAPPDPRRVYIVGSCEFKTV